MTCDRLVTCSCLPTGPGFEIGISLVPETRQSIFTMPNSERKRMMKKLNATEWYKTLFLRCSMVWSFVHESLGLRNCPYFIKQIDLEDAARVRSLHVLRRQGRGQRPRGSFSAVSKPNFARKYPLESSRRDLHNALLCAVLESEIEKPG